MLCTREGNGAYSEVLKRPYNELTDLGRKTPLTTAVPQTPMTQSHKLTRAFTIIELVAIITVTGLLAVILIPALARTRASAARILCTNNLKQIGVAFQTWALSHGLAYPMRVSVSSGGYADYLGQRTVAPTQISSRGVFGDFLVMSNELVTPKILTCSSENEARIQATIFSGVIPVGATNARPFVNDLNVSYFIGVDAFESLPRMFLAGDHNLGSDGNLVPLQGFVTPPTRYSPSFSVSLGTNFTPNAGVGWLQTMHNEKGNVLLVDGSVQQFNRDHLQQALRNSGSQPGGAGGNFPNPPGCVGAYANRIQFP